MEDRDLLPHEKIDLLFIFIAFFAVIIILLSYQFYNIKDDIMLGSNPKKPVTVNDINSNSIISNNPIDVSNTGYVPSVHQIDPSIISTTDSSNEPILKVSPTTSSDIRSIIQNNSQANKDSINLVTKDFLGFIYPPRTPVANVVYGSAYGNGRYNINITDPGISNSDSIRLWSDDVTLKPFSSSHIFNNPMYTGVIDDNYKKLMVNKSDFYIGYEIIITLPEKLNITGILFNGPDYRSMPNEFVVYGKTENINCISTSMILINTQGIKNNLVVYPVNNKQLFNTIIISIKSINSSNDKTSSIDTLQLYTLKIMGYPNNIKKSNLKIKPYTASLVFGT